MTKEDLQIIQSLKSGNQKRLWGENTLYATYNYFIDEGSKKFSINNDDSFSAYSDAVLSAINNIAGGKFDEQSSIKTYLFKIFSNKCIDLVRKSTTNKQQVNKTMSTPDLLSQMPERAKSAIEKLMNDEKRKALASALELIDDKCRKTLLLYEEGFSDKEIAEQQGYNTADVAKTSRLRCLEKLKKRI